MSPKELRKKLSNTQNLRNIPFDLIIKCLFNVSVKKFDRNDKSNLEILNKIEKAMIQVCKNIQKQPIKANRANEAGNAIEPMVIEELNRIGYGSF